MKQKMINLGLVLAAVALLGFLAFHVKLRPAANEVALLKTIGMTCGSCATKIEESLRSLPGIAGVEVDVNGGWVLVGYDSHTARPDTFAGAVYKSGFRSWLMERMSVQEFRQVAGRDFGAKSANGGCCGKGGCGSAKKN